MATSDSSLSSSVLASSDVIYDYYCQPCSAEKLNIEATGFCEQCKEYLCTTCCNYHRKSTASKHHKVLDKAVMPKTESTSNVQDVLTEMCPKHNDKVMEYICNKHDELCCSVCMSTKHKSCKKKAHYIQDISDGTAGSKEYKDLVTMLARIVTTATIEQARADVNDKDNDANLSKVIGDIKVCRTEMDKILDTTVEEAIKDATRLHKEISDKISNSRRKCQSVLSDVNAKTKAFENKAKASKNNQLFVDMKLTLRNSLPTIEKDIQHVTDRTFSHLEFDKEKKVQELKSTLSAKFRASVRKEGQEVLKARYVQEVNARSVEDKNDCFINDIAVMSTDRLVVTDYNNTAVKLVDVWQNSVINRMTMSSAPLDVIKITPTDVAVALGSENKIEILAVSDVLARSHAINVSGCTFSSLCYLNDGDRFVLLDTKERAVKIVDMSGRVLSTVYKDPDNNNMLKQPRYIALSRGQDLLYITDHAANAVITMTIEGRVVSVYRYSDLKCPLGVAAGRDGAVYVCSEDTHTVHQLSSTGQRVKILIEANLGRMFLNSLMDEGRRERIAYPRAIAYDEDNSKLCVSSNCLKHESNDYIRLFQLRK